MKILPMLLQTGLALPVLGQPYYVMRFKALSLLIAAVLSCAGTTRGAGRYV